MQPAAGLSDDPKDARNAEGRATFLDELVQSGSRQQRHDEERLLGTGLREFADVINADDIRMDHRGQNAPFLVEKLDCVGVVDLQNGLQGHVPLHERIVGFVDDAHAAASQNVPELVTLL